MTENLTGNSKPISNSERDEEFICSVRQTYMTVIIIVCLDFDFVQTARWVADPEEVYIRATVKSVSDIYLISEI